ncbi:MAG TPA: hypothetical protein VKV26_00345 [Dehalococcoidia bacterium]|nr:hypothetical protein [Dehalococcoidia bacterium]
MRVLLHLLPLISVFVLACGGGSHHATHAPASNASFVAPQALAATPRVAPPTTGTPAPAALVMPAGLQDVGQFVVSASGPVQAENRAATMVLHLRRGDEIHFPPSMTWGTLPNVGLSAPHWIGAAVRLSGHLLYLTGETGFGPGDAAFDRADDRTFRVTMPGEVLFWANEDGVRNEGGTLADYPIAVDAAGHLWLGPLPVPPNSVVDYNTGVGLDLGGMKRVGWLPSAGNTGAFFFTTCGPATCGYTDRLATTLTSPITGTLTCRSGTNFDLVGDGYRLLFRDTATLIRPRDSTPTATPAAACGQSFAIQAGEPVDDTGAHYFVTAVASDGEPLSVVVAYDGTLYVGHLTAPPLEGPSRAL